MNQAHKVRCKYVDSSKNVKFYSNLMVWWRSLRHSNQREKSKEGTGVMHPEAQNCHLELVKETSL
jgi:hypothetical protein